MSRTVLPVFERLARGGQERKDPSLALLEAVRENLQTLLNARRGMVPHLPDYGLPDVSRVFAHEPECLEYLRRAIVETVRRYEPRLENVRVQRVAEARGDLALCFHIHATLMLPSRDEIVYEMTFRDAQEIEVRPRGKESR